MARTRFDSAKLRLAIRDFSRIMEKSKVEVVRQVAKGFVKDIVAITPPASGKFSGSDAKKRGEDCIKIGLATLFTVADQSVSDPFEDPMQAHKAAQDPNTGRIAARGVGRKVPITRANLATVMKALVARVGWLAAGWNAAALALGVPLPAWVKRHGSRYGEYKVTITDTLVRIEISNEVSFVGSVKAYARRMDAAMSYQTGKLTRQMDHVIARDLKRTHW